MADNTTSIIFTAQDRASEVMRRLSANVERIESSFDKLSAPVLRFQTLWATLVGGAIVAGLRSLVSAIDDLDEAAQALGTTATELANLRLAAGQAGVGTDTLDTALTRLNVNLSEAASGSKEQLALFKALGVSVRDSAGNIRPTTEVLKQLANVFATLTDPAARAALAVDLFGKSGAKLVPLLVQGGGALEKFAGLSEKTVEEARRLQGEVDKLSASWESFKFTLASNVIPVVNKTIEALTGLGTEEQRIAQLRQTIRSMEFQQTGNPAVLQQYKDELQALEQRRRALAEGAKVSGAEAVQAGRSAQAIRDKVAADLDAERATRRKAKATEEASNAYAKEFADVARIRANRERERQADEDERTRAAERQRQRLADLTGQTGAQQWLDDMQALDEAFFSGAISAEKYEAGMRKAFGLNSDIEKGLQRQTDLSEQLGLTMASSLGELITSGGRASDVWKALGQDLAKLITQALILKPLARELQQIFEGFGKSGGAGGSGGVGGIFGSLLNSVISGLGQMNFGGGQNLDGSWGFSGHAGIASAGRGVTVYIDGATDRAQIATLVERGVKAGIAASVDGRARGGSGVIG